MKEKMLWGPHPVSAQVLRERVEERKRKKVGGGPGIYTEPLTSPITTFLPHQNSEKRQASDFHLMSSSIYFVTARFSFSFQKNGGARAKILLNSHRSICSEKAWVICCSSISNIPPILGTDLMFKRAFNCSCWAH